MLDSHSVKVAVKIAASAISISCCFLSVLAVTGSLTSISLGLTDTLLYSHFELIQGDFCPSKCLEVVDFELGR